jgi:hypothetical protein
MKELILFNMLLIVIIVGIMIVLKKYVKSSKGENIAILITSISVALCHYSSIPYHIFTSGSAMDFLRSNPNLLLPIYPCNVVMWLGIVYGVSKNKESKFNRFLCDYLFWFGIISALVGMFVNIDFMNNPSFKDYDVVKGIVAHAIMLLNVLLLPLFNRIKIKLERNMLHILISVIMMYVIGLYCNLMFETLVSYDKAYNVNSMFILHSPFEGVDFLTYPIIGVMAIGFYFIVFAIAEMFTYKRGDRFYNRIVNCFKNKEKKENLE